MVWVQPLRWIDRSTSTTWRWSWRIEDEVVNKLCAVRVVWLLSHSQFLIFISHKLVVFYFSLNSKKIRSKSGRRINSNPTRFFSCRPDFDPFRVRFGVHVRFLSLFRVRFESCFRLGQELPGLGGGVKGWVFPSPLYIYDEKRVGFSITTKFDWFVVWD